MTTFPMRRLRFVCEEPLKYGANAAAQHDDPEWPRFVRITDITESGQLKKDTFRTLPPEIAKDYLLKEGDILLARSGSIGRSFIYRSEWGDACFAGYLVRARLSQEFDPQFVYWSLNSMNYWSWIESTAIRSTIQNISAERYAEYAVPAPPLATQRRIAQFLDKRTAWIDELIVKKRTLLDLLAENRQALITRAVTKGLEPEGHKKTERSFEDGVFDADGSISSFVWGGLPEKTAHIREGVWDSSWLKWSVDLSTNRPAEEEQAKLPYISNENIESWTGELLVKGESESQSAGTADGRMFKKNDVLFNKLRPYLAKVYHATFDGVNSGELLCLRPTHTVVSRFLFYVLLSKAFIDAVNAETFGAKMPRANWEIVGHQPLPLPPLEIQEKIARFLDEKTTQIDKLQSLIVQSVDKLAEHHSALITAAVTGQITDL